MKALETFIDEVSAVMDHMSVLDLYHTATYEPYSCLYVKLTAEHKDAMLYRLFDAMLVIKWFIQLIMTRYTDSILCLIIYSCVLVVIII